MMESSARDIQEQIRQQQLLGMRPPPQQQPFHPMAGGENYGAYVPQAPFQIANVQDGGRTRGAGGTPVYMGNLSLLSISFSLMFLGAFTFLGGFFLGVWVAAPRTYGPPLQNPYYPTGAAYQQNRQQGSNFEQNFERQMSSAIESSVKNYDIPGVPNVLSPLVKAPQSEVGRQVGSKTGEFFGQPSGTSPSYSRPQFSPPPPAPVESYSPQPSGGQTQLPVVTPQSGATSGISFQANEDAYTVQLGVYAAHENANTLVNHMQSLGYTSHVIEGKTPDGGKEYYVRSGSYKDYSTAVKAASQFVEQNIPDAIIVKTNSQPQRDL